MAESQKRKVRLEFHPLTPDRWDDFEKFFGERGACGNCWCTYWRQTRSQYMNGKSGANKASMRKIVQSGEIPGILAYQDNVPIGWCAVAPRETYTALSRSRILAPVDDSPVWSVTCFHVDKRHRRQGVSLELLKAAVKWVRQKGGKIVEGYPIEPKNLTVKVPVTFYWTGFASTFVKAGFKECARRSETRPIMRYFID